jgi:hypothetical protein
MVVVGVDTGTVHGVVVELLLNGYCCGVPVAVHPPPRPKPAKLRTGGNVGDADRYVFNAVLKVSRSEILWPSLACAKSSAGLRIMVTAAAKTPKIAMTIKSSIRVKPFLVLNIND